MELGWVKLYRKILDNEFLVWDNTAYLLFTKLLLYADHKTGAYATGQRALAEQANLPYGTTYSALKRLNEHGLIHIENKHRYSKIFITNWTVYQSNKEVDVVLEQNHEQIVKQSNKRSQQVKTRDSQAPRQARVKHDSSARQDYNKKEELRTNNIFTNVNTLGEHKNAVSKIFYEIIKKLDLPKTNNNNIRKWINDMAQDPDHEKIINYLVFLRDQYQTTEWEYKPQISEAFHIHSKRAQIRETFKRAVKGQNKSTIGVVE